MAEKKQKNNNLFKIRLNPPDYSMADALEEHGHDLSKVILEKVSYAIDNNLETIDIGEIITPFDKITMKSSRRNFLDTLEQNLEKFISYEDYERCIICKKYIDLLKNNLETSK